MDNKEQDRSGTRMLQVFLPVSTQSLSGWLLSPWIHMAGHLNKKQNHNDVVGLANSEQVTEFFA